MNKKWIFRGAALLVVLAVAACMFLIGRGHTVYIDNKTLEVYVGGERLSRLAKRERTMSTVIGQSFEMRLVNTVNKGDEPTEEIVKLSLPYSWDGIVVNVPAYLAGLPQDVWMTEFIAAPEPETEEEEDLPSEDEIPMGDF